MVNTELVDQQETLARAGLYGLLSAVLLREFDADSLNTLRSDEWQSSLAALEIELPEDDHSVLEELAVDYCRIFVGPKDFCPPYQSIWESGQFQGRVIESMNEFSEVVTAESEAGIKDHAGLQFEFMAIILRQEATSPAPAIGLSNVFFGDHIAWTHKMFVYAAEMAQSDFYGSLLRAGADFVASEMRFYESKVLNVS